MGLIANCIGCGCDDYHACIDERNFPCSWLAVDYSNGLGVCSSCEEHLARWKKGNRETKVIPAHSCPLIKT